MKFQLSVCQLALSGEATVAAQRDSFAYKLDPGRFVLVGMERDEDGERIPICAPASLSLKLQF